MLAWVEGLSKSFFFFSPLLLSYMLPLNKHELNDNLFLCVCVFWVTSLAWVELNLILAKLHFTYDIEFLNGDQLDLHRDSWIETLWSKPELRVRVSPRG